MNIFVLHHIPAVCASMYCDIHVNKMLLETCQLLCGVHEHAPYKRTHYNHPCAKWTRECAANYAWLEELGNALSLEYTKRKGKRHACDNVLDWIANNTPELPNMPMTEWPQCMPEEYKCVNTIAAYRAYYAAKMQSFRERGIFTHSLHL